MYLGIYAAFTSVNQSRLSQSHFGPKDREYREGLTSVPAFDFRKPGPDMLVSKVIALAVIRWRRRNGNGSIVR